MTTTKKHHDIGFLLIAVLKLLKGLLLLIVGIGAFSLLNQNLTGTVKHWAQLMQIDLDSRFMQRLVAHLSGVDRHEIKVVAWTTLIYAALLLTEGTGLLCEKVWAEYMTFIITTSFIPWEGYKLVSRPTQSRVILIVLNCLVSGYLAWRLHQRALDKRKSKHQGFTPTSESPAAGDQVYVK